MRRFGFHRSLAVSGNLVACDRLGRWRGPTLLFGVVLGLGCFGATLRLAYAAWPVPPVLTGIVLSIAVAGSVAVGILYLLRGSSRTAAVLLLVSTASAPAGTLDASTAAVRTEAGYLRENNMAMARMMDGMNVRPTGNVDHDFVAMMVPHHQGAIDMAVAVLRHGHDERLKRIAQGSSSNSSRKSRRCASRSASRCPLRLRHPRELRR